MARRSARVRANLAITIAFSDRVAPISCRTRDVSEAGVFLELNPQVIEVDLGATVTMSVMDDARGEVLELAGRVARLVEPLGAQAGGLGVALLEPPPGWPSLVARAAAGKRAPSEPARRRMRVLVVGDDARRRGAMALYVTSGWDVRFASDLPTTREALAGFRIDAIVAEHDLEDPRWTRILDEVKRQQPMARRVIRAPLKGRQPPPPGAPDDLVHCIVDVDAGLEAFVAAITDT